MDAFRLTLKGDCVAQIDAFKHRFELVIPVPSLTQNIQEKIDFGRREQFQTGLGRGGRERRTVYRVRGGGIGEIEAEKFESFLDGLGFA